MVASGFAGLGYQIVWTQQTSLSLGHESAAVLAVVTAFFGGLAVGGLAFGSTIAQSARPALWYAGCEGAIALWSVVLLWAGPRASEGILRATGVQPSTYWQWSVAFASTFLLFLPATAAMGATLPAMDRLATRVGHGAPVFAGLYASNTLGAVLGVLATAFAVIPRVGLARTSLACGALNLVCALVALRIFPEAAPSAVAPVVDRDPQRAAGWRLAVSGLLGVGYEVLVVRVLSQVTEDTVYTFAILLAVYLAGSAAGAAAYPRWLERHRKDARLTQGLFLVMSSACLAGSGALFAAGWLNASARAALGDHVASAMLAEALVAIVAFAPATMVMGALFTHLSHAARDAGMSFGRALGVNTLAGAAAPWVFGVIALPRLGAKNALSCVVLGYVLAAAVGAGRSRAVALVGVATVAAAALAPPLRFVSVPTAGHLVSYQEGVNAAVSVVEDGDGVARLRIDNRQQEGSSATRRVDARQAWLPLLLHPWPRRALFVGLGTGVTATAAAEDPTLAVDAVELLPEVIAASRHFAPDLERGRARARLHVIGADARRYMHQSEHRYDVIVADNFHPARAGSGALYTVEHFESVRLRLERGGVFCQWLPLHQLDLATVRTIVASFLAVYPEAWAMLASYSLETPVLGLVGREGNVRIDVGALQDRLRRVGNPALVRELALDDDLAVLGSAVAGPAALRRFSVGADLNTDDLPVVAYRAPRMTYASDSRPRDRLIALLAELTVNAGEIIAPKPGVAGDVWARRLAAYWSARDRFILTGRDVRPSADVRGMLAQVREPLLAVLRISPEFRPAREPLVAMAEVLGRSDPAAARALLLELARVGIDGGDPSRWAASSRADGERSTPPHE